MHKINRPLLCPTKISHGMEDMGPTYHNTSALGTGLQIPFQISLFASSLSENPRPVNSTPAPFPCCHLSALPSDKSSLGTNRFSHSHRLRALFFLLIPTDSSHGQCPSNPSLWALWKHPAPSHKLTLLSSQAHVRMLILPYPK